VNFLRLVELLFRPEQETRRCELLRRLGREIINLAEPR